MPDGSLTLLIASILALMVGPLFYRVASTNDRALSFVDGLVLASIGGLIFFFVLPEAWKLGGVAALAAMLAGVGFPIVLERWLSHGKTHKVMLFFGALGLVLHTVFDGLTLGSEAHHHDVRPLSLAVLLHRFPVGLAIWAMMRPYGRKWGVAVLSVIALGTVLGFVVGDNIAAVMTTAPVAVFQAFVAGSLLHVVLHRAHGTEGAKESPVFQTLGALVGVLGIVGVMQLGASHGHSHHNEGYFSRLLSLSLESAGPLLLGFVLAAIIGAVWKLGVPRWLRRGNSATLAVKGTLVGLPLPICSCGVVPIYDRMIRAGVPPAAAGAFLVATPELGIESLVLSLPLLGAELTGLRLGAAAILALLVGLLMGRIAKPFPVAEQEADTSFSRPSIKEIKGHLREVVDETAPWILTGLAVAAVFQPASFASWLGGLPFGAEVVLFGLVGIPVYVCASGATPIAAAFIFAGVSPGAALAFLLSGPATNVTTFGVLSTLHSRKTAIVFGSSVWVLAVLMGLGVNAILPGFKLASLDSGIHDYSWVSWASLVLLGVLVLDATARTGVRTFLNKISILGTHHGHEHCGDECDSPCGDSHHHNHHHHHHTDCCAHEHPVDRKESRVLRRNAPANFVLSKEALSAQNKEPGA